MSLPLLTDTVTPPRRPVPSDGTGPVGRWVLHRAGLLNVWQYDRVELRFGGGRLLLRGKNGAGKSKALEVLLPFLLDGDSRRLDATGRDRTTVTWLMTDGRSPGNHVGYVWLELRCEDDDGNERFLTLGAGLKASTATRRSDAWFFMTERRVGADFELDRAGECLSVERLKEVVGDEAVTASGSEHRRRVGRHVFGLFDEARYTNVLHLLHRLRDPNIGNRVEAGELATVLSEALPPIDETVLADTAGRFDDLDAIREQVDRAQRTAAALGRFLGTYRGYARGVLRGRALRVADGEAARAAAARKLRQAERAIADAEREVEGATAALTAHHAARVASEDERRALEHSDAYRAHQDLVDREARVEALGIAAATAESAASRAASAAQRAADDVAAAERSMREAFEHLGSTAHAVSDLAVDAGMDRQLLGSPLVTAPDGSLPDDALTSAAERARRASVLVDARRRRATEIRALAVRAERAAADAAAAGERAASSEADVERERAAVATARDAHDGAERAWSEAVGSWLASGLAGSCGAEWSAARVLLDAHDRRSDWVDGVRAAVDRALIPPIAAARAAAAEADARAVSAAHEVTEAEARLAELEAQHEARPAPSRYRDAERDPAAGAPFYELVDLCPGVDPATAAGVEAALEASGLLDAWVSADGLVVHPRTRDTIVWSDARVLPATATSLRAVLDPVLADDMAVAPGTVATVLSAIGFGEHDEATTWVADDGRWSLGVLHGAWSKPGVEFLGAGARQRTRLRRLAELRDVVDAAKAVQAAAIAVAEAAADHRDQLVSLTSGLPPAEAVVHAAREVAAAERLLAAAISRHDDDRRRAEAARAGANRLAAELAHEAGGDGLPTGVEALEAVLAAVADLRQGLGDHRRALDTLADRYGRWSESCAGLIERRREADDTEAEARSRRADHASAAHELDTLRRSLGSSVAAVLDQLAAVGRRLAELTERTIPAAQDRRDQAVEARSTAVANLEVAGQGDGAASAELAAAIVAMAEALALPGVLLAASGTDTLASDDGAPGDEVAEARRLLAAVDGDDDVLDSTVLAHYDTLSHELAGGYDTAIDEVDGVKVVHVDDENGRQPLAAVAERVAAEAQASRGRLAAREREVLERFLLRELGDEVRSKLLDAHDLVRDTNRALAGVRTSHGKGARLDWALRDDAAAPAAIAARLLVDDLRGDEGDAQLRDALLALIDSERAVDPSASYEHHLRAALDYRKWHRFAVRVTDAADPGAGRILSNRLGLSQGEQRVLSYLALFAAAAAQFDAIGRTTPTAPRLLLLDDAFAKVDEPTHGRLLGLLVELGLDFVVTSERLWGCFPSVPSLEIYEAIRDPAEVGVALVHFRWDGRQRSLVGV